ncbi:uncharacterized protein F5Z01DRAFT_636050 [Emericellopsis atlantica]|uniref:Uncharacterized protein n=1 Tax=Emericellopsis atlantica TaxID=2614577 RepID=A0A9P7ZM54_9HYPO|nr:uncharacterized protein F5Z01DRAFT_636050 [Emericellopsis atlantica]KAG9254560.1 hypothetical protein F5Z01DRAFT_636050 [Emericellopsis atlantica]
MSLLNLGNLLSVSAPALGLNISVNLGRSLNANPPVLHRDAHPILGRDETESSSSLVADPADAFVKSSLSPAIEVRDTKPADDGTVEVPESELVDILDKLVDLENQVEGLMGQDGEGEVASIKETQDAGSGSDGVGNVGGQDSQTSSGATKDGKTPSSEIADGGEGLSTSTPTASGLPKGKTGEDNSDDASTNNFANVDGGDKTEEEDNGKGADGGPAGKSLVNANNQNIPLLTLSGKSLPGGGGVFKEESMVETVVSTIDSTSTTTMTRTITTTVTLWPATKTTTTSSAAMRQSETSTPSATGPVANIRLGLGGQFKEVDSKSSFSWANSTFTSAAARPDPSVHLGGQFIEAEQSLSSSPVNSLPLNSSAATSKLDSLESQVTTPAATSASLDLASPFRELYKASAPYANTTTSAGFKTVVRP